MKIYYTSYRLKCIHPFGISRSTFSTYDRVFVYLESDGLTGRGEAAPSPRYHEDTESILRQLNEIETFPDDLADYVEVEGYIKKISGEIKSLEAAMSMAWLDWFGQSRNIPVYSLFNATSKLPVTSFTIAIGDLNVIPDKIVEAEKYPILKIKLGTDRDKEIVTRIRAITDKPLRIDANEGWDRKTAHSMVDWLSDKNVEFVEQPLPAADLEETALLRKDSALDIFADENSMNSRNLPEIAHAFDGINIKLSKCGTLFEASRMIKGAQKLGLKTMLGCMVESSIGITAAGHLSSLVDYADLDGNLLINNDPYNGITTKDGKLIFKDHISGLGLEQNETKQSGLL